MNIFSHWTGPHFWARFFVMIFSIILMGLTLSLLVQVGWGTDSYSFMNLNISSRLGWSLGNWQLSLNAVLLIVTIIFGWNLIGFGTIANMVLVGYSADAGMLLWKATGIGEIIHANFYISLTVFAVSIILFVLFAAIYLNSNMGISPYDAIIKIISNKFPRVPFALLRIFYDLTVALIGFLSTYKSQIGMQGSLTGSIAISLLLGPAITLVGKFMKKHFSVFQ